MNLYSLLRVAHDLCIGSQRSFTRQRLARRRRPVLRRLIALGIAVKRALEIAEGNHEAGPAVDEAEFENIMLQKRPQSMAERTRHRDALVRELRGAERGIPVHFPDDLFEVTERHLPDRV